MSEAAKNLGTILGATALAIVGVPPKLGYHLQQRISRPFHAGRQPKRSLTRTKTVPIEIKNATEVNKLNRREFATMQRTLATTEKSNSGAVSVEILGCKAPVVYLKQELPSSLDEISLAMEIEQAVMEASQRHSEEMNLILEALIASKQELKYVQHVAPAEKQFLDALESLDSDGYSSDGNVQVCLQGDGELFVKFYNNVVRRTDISTRALEQEINEAMDEARKEASWQVRKMATTYRPKLSR